MVKAASTRLKIPSWVWPATGGRAWCKQIAISPTTTTTAADAAAAAAAAATATASAQWHVKHHQEREVERARQCSSTLVAAALLALARGIDDVVGELAVAHAVLEVRGNCLQHRRIVEEDGPRRDPTHAHGVPVAVGAGSAGLRRGLRPPGVGPAAELRACIRDRRTNFI